MKHNKLLLVFLPLFLIGCEINNDGNDNVCNELRAPLSFEISNLSEDYMELNDIKFTINYGLFLEGSSIEGNSYELLMFYEEGNLINLHTFENVSENDSFTYSEEDCNVALYKSSYEINIDSSNINTEKNSFYLRLNEYSFNENGDKLQGSTMDTKIYYTISDSTIKLSLN